MSQPAVTAVVVSYQTGPRLKECLYALRADPDVSDMVVVDNGNPDEMQTWLQAFAEKHDQVQLLKGHGNVGFGAGVNRGVAAAPGPLILVINPDAVLRRNSVPGLQALAQTLTAPFIIGGKIFGLDGQEERGGRRKDLTLWRAATSLIGWNTWTLEGTPPPGEPTPMPVISGAFFLTSQESMTILGGFDEGYFLHVEDVDLCRRCREAGGTVMYDPRAAALHYGSTSNIAAQSVQSHKADSLARYFRKFSNGPIEGSLLSVALPVMRLAMRISRR